MALFLSLGNKRGTLSCKRASSWNFTLLLSLSFSLLFVTYSCSNNKVSSESDIAVIDFVSGLNNPRIVDLSEIATDIEYIPLETTEESLIGRYPTVSIGNNRIYVVSGRKEVKIFDIKGNYLFTFNRTGRGPQEYLMAQWFKFDEESGDIIVNAFTPGSADMVFRINRYDSLGKFISSEQIVKIDSCFITMPIRINENLYLGAVPDISMNKPDFWIAAFQKNGQVVKKFSSPPFKQQDYLDKQAEMSLLPVDGNSVVPVFNLSPSLYLTGNYTRVFSRYLDTLYAIDSNLQCTPEFIIDYGSIKADGTVPEGVKKGEGEYVKLDEKKYQEWRDNILLNYDLNGYAFDPYETSLNVRTRVITVKHTDAYALFNKESAEFAFMKQPIKGKPGFNDNLKGGPPFIPQFITKDGNYAVSLLSAQEILEHAATGQMKGEFAKIASKIDEMDNHVVVIVKLK